MLLLIMTRRILSLWFPRLASDLVLRRAMTAAHPVPPLAIVARQGRGDVLVCVNAAAQAQGLRAGQPLSDARALVPTLVTQPQDLDAQTRSLQALRRWGLRYVPWVAIDGADGLVMDLTGSAHLRGGEEPLAQDLLDRMAAMGLEARAAIAPTRGAAWALARHGRRSLERSDDAHAALADLPLGALRLPDDTVQGLSRLGLRVVRDLSCAPRAALVRRFGGDLMLRLDQALGAVAEPVAPPPQDPVHAVRLSLPDPIGLTSDVMAGVERLLNRLCAQLAQHDRGARHLRLELTRADATRTEAEITLARPMRDARAMATLFQRAVEALDAGFGFDAMRLSAPVTEPLPPQQMSTARAMGSDDLADLMTRLGNRLGLEALERFLPADSHIPERSFQTAAAAFTEAPGPAVWAEAAPEPRPLDLFPPEALTVYAGLAGQNAPAPPRRFRWRRQVLQVVAAQGPERLAPEWWLDDPLWRSGVRDYWRLDTAEGPRLWVFHTPQELGQASGQKPSWSVQGEFA